MLYLSSFSKKDIKLLSLLLFIIFLFFGYIFYTYLEIQKDLEKTVQKNLLQNYHIYKKLILKYKTPISILIDNPNYVDDKELIEEMKKSTPLLTSMEKEHESRFDITFKFFKKDKKYSDDIEKLITELNKKEYKISFDDTIDQFILFGIIEDQGYILINQHRDDTKYIDNKMGDLIFLFTFFGLITIVFFFYLLHIKQKLQARAFALNQTYEQLYDDTKKMAFEDKLTKASTRLKFDETLKDLIQVASRFEEQVFSLIIIDIDNFKSVNDTYGHDYGDIVLKEVAGVVLKHIRGSETFARWGGEEFVILSPLTNLEHSVAFANKLRVAISKIEFEKLQSITCSFGVCEYRQGDDEKILIKRADQFLYKAKQNGKNRVEF